MVVRALLPDDASGARALARAELHGTPYAEGPLHALERAIGGGDDEAHGLVALSGRELVGLALVGRVAGSVGAARLHLVVVAASARMAGVARALVDAAAAELASRGARFLLAEMPEDPALEAGHALLRRTGFGVESRIADFFRDGVGIAFMRRDLA